MSDLTNPSEARSLIAAVDSARAKTRETLRNGTLDTILLITAQHVSVVAAVGHVSNTSREVGGAAGIAAAFIVVCVVSVRARHALGSKLSVASTTLPTCLFIADVVINFTVAGPGELVGRAVAFGVAGLLLAVLNRNYVTAAISGLIVIVGIADPVNWNRALGIGLAVVWVAAVLFVGRKQVFAKS